MSDSDRRPLPWPYMWRDFSVDRAAGASLAEIGYIDSVGRHGVVIRHRDIGMGWLSSGIVGSLLTGLVAVVIVRRLLIDPTSRGAETFITLIAFGGLAVLFLLGLINTCKGIVRQRKVGRFVAVTPTGVYHQTLLWTAFFPWDDIRAVSAYPSNQRVSLVPWKHAERIFVNDQRRIKISKMEVDSPANTGFDAGELVIEDPAVMYWGLKFYHENPEYRRELGTEAGLRRFQEGDFPAEEESGS